MAIRTLYAARQTGDGGTDFISAYDADDFTFLYNLYGEEGVSSGSVTYTIQENPDNGNIVVLLQKSSLDPGTNQRILIFDSAGSFLSEFDLDPILAHIGCSMFVAGTDAIYVVDSPYTPSPYTRIVKLDDTGVELDSWNVLPGEATDYPNLVIIGDVAYYTTGGPIIQSWDLLGDAALPDVYTIPDLRIGSMTLTDDGNLAVVGGPDVAEAGFLYIVDTSGTLLDTINNGFQWSVQVKGFNLWTGGYNNFASGINRATVCTPSRDKGFGATVSAGAFWVTGPSVEGVCPVIFDRTLYTGVIEDLGGDVFRGSVQIYDADTGAYGGEFADVGAYEVRHIAASEAGVIYIGVRPFVAPFNDVHVLVYGDDGTFLIDIPQASAHFDDVHSICPVEDSKVWVGLNHYGTGHLNSARKYDISGTTLAEKVSVESGGMVSMVVVGEEIFYADSSSTVRVVSIPLNTVTRTWTESGYHLRLTQDDSGDIISYDPAGALYKVIAANGNSGASYNGVYGDGDPDHTQILSLMFMGSVLWATDKTGKLYRLGHRIGHLIANDVVINPLDQFPDYISEWGENRSNANSMVVVGPYVDGATLHIVKKIFPIVILGVTFQIEMSWNGETNTEEEGPFWPPTQTLSPTQSVDFIYLYPAADYACVEESNILFTTTYTINGEEVDPMHLTVAEGDEITLTIENTYVTPPVIPDNSWKLYRFDVKFRVEDSA